MNNNKKKIEELNSKKDLVFSSSFHNPIAIKEIIDILNLIEPGEIKYFEEFINQFKSDLFSRGISYNNLKIKDFDKPSAKLAASIITKKKESKKTDETTNVSSKKTIDNSDKDMVEVDTRTPYNEEKKVVMDEDKKESISSIRQYQKIEANFEELFQTLTTTISDLFQVLKGYFLFKLENNPFEPCRLLILHDSTFFIQPIKKKISGTITNSIFKTIDEFCDDLDSGSFQEENLLCLMLLNSRANDEEAKTKLLIHLKMILGKYKDFKNYSLKFNSKLKSYTSDNSNLKDDFFEEVEYVTGTLLSNGLIKNEEEKIIKKLVKDIETPLLIYKTLKGGNSGAKVIEVRPKKEIAGEHERRYIIKYSEKNEEGKIKNEKKCFGSWIGGYKGFSEYECVYEKTLTHEGVRYSYAISDTELESYSYCEIISNSDNKFHSEKIDTIDALFDIEIYQIWMDSIELKEFKVCELYADYIKSDKTFKEVEIILNLTSEQCKEDELYINFQKIWGHTLKFNYKVCHGDLHTENFFKDKKGIYLIDFGYTGMRHAIIDHTALECSIKFKHIPRYIDINELINIEKELVLENSFNLSHKFTATKRFDVLELLDIIKHIRFKSKVLLNDENLPIEYFISLFIMTFKQIRYKDLNQLYAYHSALILSKKIITLIDN